MIRFTMMALSFMKNSVPPELRQSFGASLLLRILTCARAITAHRHWKDFGQLYRRCDGFPVGHEANFAYRLYKFGYGFRQNWVRVPMR
jgi:hypothetical protein